MSPFELRLGDWIASNDTDEQRACTAAELTILVDEIPLTRLVDEGSRTTTDRARVSLYPLAEWFASNWWRLHEESPTEITDEGGIQPPADWRLSHDLAAVGCGLIWPRVRFVSDGDTIQVSAKAIRNASWEPVRHLNDLLPARGVTVKNFDEQIDNLISNVLLRLEASKVSLQPLKSIWADVTAERNDPEAREWRQWEARMGYDPEMVSSTLMEQIESLFRQAGKEATRELAPLLSETNADMITQIRNLSSETGISATFDYGRQFSTQVNPSQPWKAGYDLARRVRRALDRPNGLLDDNRLADLLGMDAASFQDQPEQDLPIGLGTIECNRTKVSLRFRKRNLAGRRFEAARFFADSIFAPESDNWLPLTDRATVRQKFQRAFAAEFLAPIEEISTIFEGGRSNSTIESISDEFNMSQLAVRSHLANHGLLSSENVFNPVATA